MFQLYLIYVKFKSNYSVSSPNSNLHNFSVLHLLLLVFYIKRISTVVHFISWIICLLSFGPWLENMSITSNTFQIYARLSLLYFSSKLLVVPVFISAVNLALNNRDSHSNNILFFYYFSYCFKTDAWQCNGGTRNYLHQQRFL